VRRREEHTQAGEQVAEDLSIASQSIRQQYVPKFAISSFCNPANGYALECCEGARSAVAGDEGDRGNKANDESEEVEVGQDLPCYNVAGTAACESPEKQQREGERDGKEGRDAVAGQMMR
jgi:hypothetical protein